MDKFWVIKIINSRTSQKGYVMDTPKGILISIDNLNANITQFTSPRLALDFIKKNKLDRNGCYTYLKSNEELMREESSSLIAAKQGDEIYYIVQKGNENKKLFFSSSDDGYYFDERDNGYCCWTNLSNIEKFISAMELSDKAIIKKFEVKKP